MKKILILLTVFVFIGNSIIAQTKEDKKAKKSEAAEKEYQAMKALINAEMFMFEGDWANSQGGRRINLISNPTFIKMDAKKANAYLPFFGTAQVGGYGAGGAIEFVGEVQNYIVTFNDKKQKATIKFSSKSKTTESFDVTINVFGSLNASVNINSSSRSTMNYNGKIKPLEKKDE